MKHIKLFETTAERDAVVLSTPYIAYIKETESFDTLDEQPIERNVNPELMDLCYRKGWCENQNYMTLAECEAVTNTQFNSLKSTNIKNISSLKELKYFSGLTTFPKKTLFDSINTVVIHFPANMKGAYESGSGNLFSNMPMLEEIKFSDHMPQPWDTSIATQAKTILNKCPKIRNFDISNTNWTQIPYHAFSTVDLNSLSLPKTLNTVSDQWAVSTTKLKWIRIFRPTVVSGITPLAVSNSSTLVNSNTRFYVPDESVDVYKTAKNFSNFANKIFPMSQWQDDMDSGIITW